MTKEELKKLEIICNNHIMKNSLSETISFNNAEVFYWICELINDNLFLPAGYKVEPYIFSASNLFMNLELVKEFYKQMSIKFDFDKNINNGTIHFIYYGENDEKPVMEGTCGIRKNHRYANISNSCSISDSAVMVHELSHLRNLPSVGRSEISHLLTEALAYAEELIFSEFLREKGFLKDSIEIKKLIAYFAIEISRFCENIFKLANIFNKFSSLSLNSYTLYYPKQKDYESVLKDFMEKAKKYKLDINISDSYILGNALGIYMYYEYKKDKNFWNNIQKLHMDINNLNFAQCLQTIQLNDFEPKDFSMLVTSLKEFSDEVCLCKTK